MNEHPVIAAVASMVSTASCPMALMVGPDGALTANSAMRGIFPCLSGEDVNGAPVCEALPEYSEFFMEVLNRACRGETFSVRDWAIRCVRGEEVITARLNMDFTPVTDGAGQYLAALCTASEVAHHVAAGQTQEPMVPASAAFGESGIQFEALTETLPQIVWSCGADGGHDYFSKRWSEFTGIPATEITAETWKQLVYPDHWDMVWSVWENARQTGEPYDIDYRFRHHSGEYRWLRVMALPIRDETGRIVRWCGTSTDVHDTYLVAEERERLARELERIATQDQLTEVLTRRALLERSAAVLLRAKDSFKATGVLMLDIDHFKRINDTYGHPVGDVVLSVAARRLWAVAKETDLIGRLGGEEFAIVLPKCDADEALAVAERVRRAIAAEPFAVGGGRKIEVTVSVGVTTTLAEPGAIEGLLSTADKALYQAKSSGRNCAVFLPSDGSGAASTD